MATPSQIAANKLNSQKSTGPTSAEGKAKSCLNHLSHGFASSTARLIGDEDPEEFKALLADLMQEYQPATPTEQIYVERMVQNRWLALRSFRLQNDALSLFPKLKIVDPKLALFIRYHVAAERAFDRAHTDLVKAQNERKKSAIGFDPKNLAKAADPIPAQPETQPKIAPPTHADTDFPAEPAAFVAPNARNDLKIVPQAPNYKNACFKSAV
jgi:hypothetical protein